MSQGTKTLVVITGANTGLGFEIAKCLFSRPTPYHVLIGCRGNVSRASDCIARLKSLAPDTPSTAEPLSIDISSDESIAAAAKEVQGKFGCVDVLINNAGADFDTAVDSGRLTPREAWTQSWDVNAAGTHLLTEALAPLLLASRAPRLLFLTSGLSSLAENAGGASPRHAHPPAGWPKPPGPAAADGGASPFPFLAYRASKAGLNMVATEWARVLRADGVRVFAVSPGFLATGLGRDRATGAARDLPALGAGDAAVGAAFCADVVDGLRDEQAWPCRVLRARGPQPW